MYQGLAIWPCLFWRGREREVENEGQGLHLSSKCLGGESTLGEQSGHLWGKWGGQRRGPAPKRLCLACERSRPTESLSHLLTQSKPGSSPAFTCRRLWTGSSKSLQP